MRSSRSLLLLALAVVLLVGGIASASETFKTVLPENGLTVILRENHSSPVVNLRFYVRAGSIYEGKYLGSGITHYIEHLMSDGTTNRTQEETEKEIEALGGGANAYTTKDHCCYFIETSSEHFDEALDILSDQAKNATLPEKAVETQKGIILREISMGYDEPGRRLYNLYGEVMFQRHPARYPTIGYAENFARITRDDLLDYHSRLFVPNNMIFVAVGDFKTEEAYAKIREAFKDFERRPIEMPALPSEPAQLGRRILREQRDLDIAYVLMGFHTVPLSHPDLYPLDLMSYILSQGKSSRLYKKIVDELGLAYSVSTSSHTPGYDGGTFSVSMALDPANIDAAIKAVTDEIGKLKTEKIPKAELDKAKKLKTAEFYMGRQDMESIAGSLGTSMLTAGNPDFDELYAQEIQKVTPEQIRDVANRYFYDDNLGIAILEPASAETAVGTATAPDKEPEVGAIERHVLPNGLTVLIKENHTNPTVDIGSFSLAGARFDEKGGLANFVANMMPRGTEKRDAETISRELDSMGAQYSLSANHTRIDAGMTLLPEDFPKGLALFADILMNPRFDPAEMEKERPLIAAAILARYDDWNTDAMDRMLALLFPTHPYGRPPVGTKESVATITREDLVRHHTELVTPDNTVLTVFGDVDAKAVLPAIEKAFAAWKSSGRGRPAPAAEPEPVEGGTVTSYHDRAQTVIFMGYRGMPYPSEDRYAMDVLDAVTSGIYYPGGWLHTELRGNSLVYVVHAYNWPGYDAGYFGVYAATYDEALDRVLGIIGKDMERIAKEKVSDQELDHAKQLCIIQNETSRQTNDTQARDAGIAELYGLGYGFPQDYPDKIKAVTKDDVLRVAQKYLKNPVTILRRPGSEKTAPEGGSGE
jgi:zinc protease